MKKIVLLFIWSFFWFQFASAQSGQPDPSFGNNGVVITNAGAAYDYPGSSRQVLTAPDGSIYISINSDILGATLISKMLPNGGLDSSYGVNGFSQALPINLACAAFQPDGVGDLRELRLFTRGL